MATAAPLSGFGWFRAYVGDNAGLHIGRAGRFNHFGFVGLVLGDLKGYSMLVICASPWADDDPLRGPPPFSE